MGPLHLVMDTSACGTSTTVRSPVTSDSNLSSYPVPEILLAIGLPDNGQGKGSSKGETLAPHSCDSEEPPVSCSGPTGCNLTRPGEEEIDGTVNAANNRDDRVGNEGGIYATTDENLTEMRE
jgi:hypothetical protein